MSLICQRKFDKTMTISVPLCYAGKAGSKSNRLSYIGNPRFSPTYPANLKMNYLVETQQRDIPQSEPLEGQVKNSAQGHSYQIDPWQRLERFLILGSEGGSYYAGQTDLTQENLDNLYHCLSEDGRRALAVARDVSVSGRAPKQEPALFLLSQALGADPETRRAALSSIGDFCRTGSQLFMLLDFIKQTKSRGFGRGLRRAISDWYLRDADKVAYQAIKYRQRYGFTHRDLLRLSHPKSNDPAQQGLFSWITSGNGDNLPQLVEDFIKLQEAASAKEAANILSANPDLPWEAIPTAMLNDKEVWEILISNTMPMTALIRNLPKLTQLGLVGSALKRDMTDTVCRQLTDQQKVIGARLHPLQILNALYTYKGGHSLRGKGSWQPSRPIIKALDEAFYLSFSGLEPTNKKWLIAVDVSGSMSWGNLASSALTPREGSAALAMAQLRVGDKAEVVAFSHGMVPVDIDPDMRLDRVLQEFSRIPMGGTDCALPMTYAQENDLDVDAFMVLTDSETWAGRVHPSEALKSYRQTHNPGARLIVNGMISNNFSIADPDDEGMLDVVGFDSAAPQIMQDFARGAF
jgi:60 kDa SS-A/Ro ribonucleoprotein